MTKFQVRYGRGSTPQNNLTKHYWPMFAADRDDEVAERVLGDRFEPPWPPQSWVHHVGLPNGYARVTFCWEGRS